MSQLDVRQQCPDCAVNIGQPHLNGCDVARCLRSGQQKLQCPAQFSGFHDCGEDAWTGLWPGAAECREYGWFSCWRSPPPGEQYGEWVRCTADCRNTDHEVSIEDYNRLVIDGHWDPTAGRWRIGGCDHKVVDEIVIDEDGPDRLLECDKCGHIVSEAILAAAGYPLPDPEFPSPAVSDPTPSN